MIPRLSQQQQHRQRRTSPASAQLTTSLCEQSKLSHQSVKEPPHSLSFQRRKVRCCCLLLVILLFMTLLSFVAASWTGARKQAFGTVKNQQSLRSSSGMSSSAEFSFEQDSIRRETALRRALWSFFAGDAIAAPTHWFYGGRTQIQQYYGPNGITKYTKPVYELAGSIMNKSDLNGGGRSKGGGSSANDLPTIIGQVINHGKQDLWSPKRQIHYHATLQAGENTLEVQLARVLMKSMVANQGRFQANHFRKAYMDFMMTPNSHNDAYASTCHRMFFANLIHRKLPPDQCPDNDGHNVDTVDGLVLPTIVSLAYAVQSNDAKDQDHMAAAQQAAVECVRVTRNSPVLEQATQAWSSMIYQVMHQPQTLPEAATTVARTMGLRAPRGDRPDEITACYLGQALPALLDSVVKYGKSNEKDSVWKALLANANTGGENVHRGSCLGAVLGAAATSSDEKVEWNANEDPMVQGLHDKVQLEKEIDDFVKVVLR